VRTRAAAAPSCCVAATIAAAWEGLKRALMLRENASDSDMAAVPARVDAGGWHDSSDVTRSRL
jgi:hypothetical protein